MTGQAPRIMQLIAHAATPAPAAVHRMEATAARAGDGRLLFLDYYLSAEIAALAVPPAADPVRADGLWRHTCFEAFVKARGEPSYLEFNFSPSGAWAAYRFDDYRQGMRPAPVAKAPRASLARDAASLNLQVAVDLASCGGIATAQVIDVGLAAVVEDRAGERSYWALAHGPGPADFHRSSTWTFSLAHDEAGDWSS